MIIDALTERGEAQVVLNSNCRDEKYIGLIKESISTHVLGSPIGYPVYIHRWARMGQSGYGTRRPFRKQIREFLAE